MGMITNAFNAKYAANLLRRGGSGLERLSTILLDAKVDLNPHQIFAAIEAPDNPYSKGRILADEVGLGKTIEAAIIIAEKWAEEKRNILVVVPATLKEQWAEELTDKFYLPVGILGENDTEIRFGEAVYICTYNYCYNHEKELREIAWDLVVFDEAHKLRNLHTESNKIDTTIASIFKDTYKILCTATPLQNSLLDLYSLATLTDENLFLDIETFKAKYIHKDNSKDLAERLQTILTRTLRKQVLEYIRYTDRYSITQEFSLNEEEQQIYEIVVKFMNEKDEKGKPKVNALQRMTLLKELASSPAALYETASKMKDSQEVCEAARHITDSSKLKALDEALKIGFANLAKAGAEQKAVIFTESLATQAYIVKHLQKTFQPRDIETLNGSTRNRGDVIYAFERWAKILVSTEVGGEGLNLQFCSMVINFDMPWNPQRIEQRIGRVHRYGQKHDVAVVNFLCRDNYADQRLYELLSHKLKLFEGVFGASDTVLGVLEDTDFEKRISDIYKEARTKEEIDKAFGDLQAELEGEIKRTKENAKQKVFEYLDTEVANRFKGIGTELGLILSRKETLLWELAKYIIGGHASFYENDHSIMFSRGRWGKKKMPCMIYKMDKSARADERFRIGSPLAQRVLNKADCNYEITSGCATYRLDDTASDSLKKLRGKSGYLALYHTTQKGGWSYGDIILVGKLADGTVLPKSLCEEILMLKASSLRQSHSDRRDDGMLIRHIEMLRDEELDILQPVFEESLREYTKSKQDGTIKYFEQFSKSMHGWADDKIASVEKALKTHERKLEELRTAAKAEKNFQRKLKLLEEIKQAEKNFADRTVEAEKAMDGIRAERDRIIEGNRRKMQIEYEGKRDFILRFTIEKEIIA